MMVKYFRIFTGFLLLILIFLFFFILQPHRKQLHDLIALKNELDERIHLLKSQTNHSTAIFPKQTLTKENVQLTLNTENTAIAQIVRLAYLQRLQLRSIRYLPNEQNKGVIHLEIEDAFDRLIQFLFELMKNETDCVFLNFSFKPLNNGHMLLISDVLLLPSFEASSTTVSKKFNPFCIALHDFNQKEKRIDTQHYSYALIKMIGYIKQAERAEAFLLLPDGQVFTARQGDIFGVEKAKLVEIKENQIIFITPDHKETSIQM